MTTLERELRDFSRTAKQAIERVGKVEGARQVASALSGHDAARAARRERLLFGFAGLLITGVNVAVTLWR